MVAIIIPRILIFTDEPGLTLQMVGDMLDE